MQLQEVVMLSGATFV